ncbi:probable serine hydrolase [Cloeon dipterum]|uniref:probable serine hydrolase n=1 Tax=Cloeon dipterum TaxID=197152 RepID=UPI00321FBCA1
MESSSVDFAKLTREYTDLIIPLPWGHIAGKWWGPRELQPVIVMHGWHENANSWDPLMNLMPKDLALFAIDLPGNGLSSHYPSSTWYHIMEDILALRKLIQYFQWKQPVTFLCHSFSTGHAFIYAASYPDEVKKVIAVDLTTPVGITHETLMQTGGKRLDKTIDIVDKSRKRTVKTLEQHAADYRKAANNSISLEAAKHVLERSMERSKSDPTLFRSTRDGRNTFRFYFSFPNDFMFDLAHRVKCEYYVIRATLPLYAEQRELTFKVEEILRNSAKKFERVNVDGKHHVHLDHPQRVLEQILRWLKADEALTKSSQSSPPNSLAKAKM